jgi:Copper type II ascorbate-dependent monooxygenase, C-terminal domain
MRYLSLLFLFGLQSLSAQTVNWATDIAPILYENCASCHRTDGIGHFSLIGYDNAFTNRTSIANAAESGKMPPWPADQNYRRYAHERLLKQSEVQLLKDWVNQGAPAGNLSAAPQPPQYSNDSSIGMPDETYTTPNFQIKATEDEYRAFVIPSGLAAAKFLRGVEILPGNHEVVHHVLIYQDITGQARALDAASPEPGYIAFGGPGVQNARLVAGWAPGAATSLFPPFMGIKVDANADLIVQMHYPKGSTGKSDQTRINFFFTEPGLATREVGVSPILNHSPVSLENYPLSIPANQVKTYHAKFKINQKGTFLNVAPHMHYIGREMTVYAVTPAQDTIPMIKIPDWDFHWQGSYTFQKPVVLPAGTWLHAYAKYNNTASNPNNPSSPPKLVTQGEATTDEMLVVYFNFTAYQNGDENMILDSTLLSSSIISVQNTDYALQIQPNLVQDQLTVHADLREPTELSLSLIDASGKTIRTHQLGKTSGLIVHQMQVTDLPKGNYRIVLSSPRGHQSMPFVKV